MEWLVANSFFLIVLLVCIGMHLSHGHGDDVGYGDDELQVRRNRHKHK